MSRNTDPARLRRYAERACGNLSRVGRGTRDTQLMEATVAAEAAMIKVLERIGELEVQALTLPDTSEAARDKQPESP